MSVLDEILAMKRDEVTLLHQPSTRDAIRRAALGAQPTRGFASRLRAHARDGGRLAVVAEIKRRSPSKGDLSPDLDASTTARTYEEGDASCLSVLTDRPFFGGSVQDLQDARSATTEVALLRKDFTIDLDQIYESRAIGADAILLIVAALTDDPLLRDLYALTTELQMDALFEVHDDTELERALTAGATVVGVNARDLGTFDEDLSVGERLASSIPAHVIAVAESAIRDVDDAQRMADVGFDAILVGEALVRAEEPQALVRSLRSIEVTQRR